MIQRFNLNMTYKRREAVAHGLIELANLIMVVLVVSQLLAQDVFNIELFLAGVAMGIIFYWSAVRLLR